MDGEHLKPVFGEAAQKAMARGGCDLTLESRHLAQTLLDLIGRCVLVADSSMRPDAEIPGDLCPARAVGHRG